MSQTIHCGRFLLSVHIFGPLMHPIAQTFPLRSDPLAFPLGLSKDDVPTFIAKMLFLLVKSCTMPVWYLCQNPYWLLKHSPSTMRAGADYSSCFFSNSYLVWTSHNPFTLCMWLTSTILLQGVRMPMLTDLTLQGCEGINSSSMAALSHCVMLEVWKLST